jgi:tetratricopeptide (TPR) repeat protein
LNNCPHVNGNAFHWSARFMTPLRVVGLMVVVFLVSLPVTFLVHGGPSLRLPSFTDSEGEGGGVPPNEEKDDPVVDVLCLKGLQAASEGDFKKAIATYTKAIERDPKYAFAYIGRGDAYAASGDLDRAIADYDWAARLDPNNPIGRERAVLARRERASQ